MVQNKAVVKGVPMTGQGQDKKSAHRLSVNMTGKQHRELSEIAHRNKVSVAWVIREAIERLLKDEFPLLHVAKE